MREYKVLFVVAVFLALAVDVKTAGAQQSAPALTADQTAGKKLFLQRCSICHMPQRPYPDATLGPHLEGLFDSGDSADVEARVRQMIRTGNPGPAGRGMPSFQYGLEPAQINQIVAFLKAFHKGDVPTRMSGAGEGGAE